MSFFNWVKKWKKDLLITFAILLALITAVLAWDWTDNAEKPFWSTFWVVAGVVAIVACVGGWIYLNSRSKK